MVRWRETLLLGARRLVSMVLRAALLTQNGQDTPWPKLSLIQPLWLRHGGHYYACVWVFNPKCLKCQGWLCYRLLSWCLCDGHVSPCPLGQGERQQGLLGHCWGLSWEGRAEYDGVCGHNVCLHYSPSLVLRFPLGERWLIYSRRNELPHRRCRSERKQAGEGEKIIPAQIFTLIVPWAAIPTVKESIGLYSDCGPQGTQRALKKI